MHTKNSLIAFKKHGIEFPPEAVDVEILQGGFLLFADGGLHVAASCLDGGGQAHVLEGLGLERDGIIKEFAEEEYARYAVAQQHHAVGGLRVGTALGKRLFDAELDGFGKEYGY